LHELVKEACKDSTIVKSRQELMTKEDSEDLREGVVLTDGPPSVCPLKTASMVLSTSCWRRPNDGPGPSLVVKMVVTVSPPPMAISRPCFSDSNYDKGMCPQDYCLCADIVDTPTFIACPVEEPEPTEEPELPDLLLVATGTVGSAPVAGSSSINLFELNGGWLQGTYTSVAERDGGYTNLPLIQNGVGDIFRGDSSSTHKTVFICEGNPAQTSADKSECFMYKKGEGFSSAFTLDGNLRYGGQSVVFNTDHGDYWWIYGENPPSGTETSLYFNMERYGDPLYGNGPTLPEAINAPCFAKVNETFAFVTGSPFTGQHPTSLAWLYDFENNIWTPLPDTKYKRLGSSCAVITHPVDGALYIVVAGGLIPPSTTKSEYMRISEGIWREGPTLPNDIMYSKMVVVEGEALLVGGYTLASNNLIGLKYDGVSDALEGHDWESMGSVAQVYNAIALPVPGNLFHDLRE